MNKDLWEVLHPQILNCPYQFKIISKGLQQYVVATPQGCATIVDNIFSKWDFGEYWGIASQSINPSNRSLVANILSNKKDRDQAAHELIRHFIIEQKPVTSGTICIAAMTLY